MKTELIMMGKHINLAPRRYRRRMVVLIYMIFTGLLIATLFGYANLLLIGAFLLAVRILGGRSHIGGMIPRVDLGDEREKNRRDHAYFLAYWWMDLVLIPALFALCLQRISSPASWNPVLREFISHLYLGPLIAAGILYYTLPQAILLWTEPDMDSDQPVLN